MLTKQPKGQLQSEHEWKEQIHTKYKDKAIYNIWVMMMAINFIQVFIINVPSQQLQRQLQTQYNVDIGNSIEDRHKIKSEAT
jgi:hypothetical protein